MASPILLTNGREQRHYWNIDANVGAASPNRTDDVQLVQLGYACMAQSSKHLDLRPIFSRVQVGAPCSGREDDPLVVAIRAHQARRGGTRDGYVSVIKTNNGAYVDVSGPHAYMLTVLIAHIADTIPGDFPRIDKHPLCPPALKEAVKRGSLI